MLWLSKNFTLKELTNSDTATRLGIANAPSPEQILNLEYLVTRVLQPIRDHYGMPVILKSGFRSLELNRALNSKDTSQHISGMAADIEINGVSNVALAEWIRDNLEFDQLILEFYTSGDPSSGWVHVSLTPRRNRNECLTITKSAIMRGIRGG